MNRLASSTSPYLLQHKDNPVDWFPWGEEAFAKAESQDKPVFLSVGYSSCHWCHVMEHESFEDAEIAKLLNENFISVKVDREERPDVDEAYMLAVQLSAGRGGWPMSIFLTPQKKPFFAGTYFPKDDRGQFTGFRTILRQIANGWKSKKSDFTKAADEFTKALKHAITREGPKTFSKPSPELLDQAVQNLTGEFDPEHGGFGAAPKFPPHSTLAFLMEYAALQSENEDLAKTALGMSLLTLEALALGGIHDHVGGGFHRYSTDEIWLLPHFEKMLYDNALLLGNFAKAAQITSSIDRDLSTLFAEASSGIIEWLNEEMRGENGLYYSAVDADSEGVEGKFYVWTEAEIRELLGDKADAFCQAFTVRPEGNFHDEAKGELTGENVLYQNDPASIKFENELSALKRARSLRVRPALDDKQIVSWNGLLLSGLAEAGEIESAEAIAEAILGYEKDGELPHLIAKGDAEGQAFLDDYAALVVGLLDLQDALDDNREASGTRDWGAEAERLAKKMVELFFDEERGGFFSTAAHHEQLFGRPKPVLDQPTPSGNALAVQALLRLGDLNRVRRALEHFTGWMETVPHATEAMLTATLWYLEAQPFAEAAVQMEPPKKSAAPPEVQVSVQPKELVASNGNGSGVIMFDIPPGWHINSHEPPAKWLTPTSISFEPLRGSVDYPGAINDAYTGHVEVPFTVELPTGEQGADFEIRIAYQPCTEQECLLAQEKKLSAVVLRG